MHRARAAGVAGIVIAIALVRWIGGAIADSVPRGQHADASDPLQTAVRAARHVRIDGPHGPIHVWIPPSFHPATGATIVYLHGYYDDADSAYVGHRLPEQFAMSALDAIFIVAEAPVGARPPVNYPSLAELLGVVEAKTGVHRGMGLVAVVGHSGAFRTIESWLDEPIMDQLVMIDALYADEEAIEAWWKASPRHRLITVGEDTLQWNEQFARDIPETVIVDRVPPTYDTWPAEARTARAVYVRAQFMHMPLVMEGIVLPGLLRLLPVPLLGDEPWQLPLGSLPSLADAGVDGP